MPTISNNEKGNKYHDSETGEFTSPGAANGGKNIEDTFSDAIVFKPKQNVNIEEANEKINDLIQKRERTKSIEYKPQNIAEAIIQGNAILGTNLQIVGYTDQTNLDYAYEMNMGLFDVKQKFPEFVNDAFLTFYGTKAMDDINKIAEIKQKNDEFIQQYSERFENEFGLDVNELSNNIFTVVDRFGKARTTSYYNTKSKTTGATTWGSIMPKTFSSDYRNDLTSLKNLSISAIYFNRKIVEKSDGLDDWKPYFSYGGFHPPLGNKTVAYANAVHELGHHIFYNLLAIMSPEEKKNPLINNFSLIKRLVIEGQVSGYGETNKQEHVAEVFSDIFCNGENASGHSKEVFNFLYSIYKNKIAKIN